MAADSEVIRSFLMQLGFRIDESGARRFATSILGISKVATETGAAIAGVAVGAEAMVQVFASGMEKLYYASQRTRASVESLQAIRFASQQVGVSAEAAAAAVEGFSRALRLNPGMGALLRGLGVDTKGKDTVQQMYALVGRLAKMPHFVGAKWAQMFGMDEQTFLMYKEKLPELIAADEKRRQMNKDAGIDAKEAADASREYGNSLRDLWEKVENIWAIISIKLLPTFREFTGAMSVALTDLTKWASGLGKTDIGGFKSDLHDIVGDLEKLGKMFSAGEANWINSLLWALKGAGLQALHVLADLVDAVLRVLTGDFSGALDKLKQAGKDLFFSREGIGIPLAGGSSPDGPGGASTRTARIKYMQNPANKEAIQNFRSYAENAAKTYGIPPAIFSAMIEHESNWDPNAVGDNGAAIGLGQLHEGAAKDAGVNRRDPYANIRGSAWYLAKQFGQFGNWHDALAAYNQGAGNVGAGGGYADTVLKMAGQGGGNNHQSNTYNIASTDPEAAGKAVGREVNRSWQDILRMGTASTR